MRFEASLFAVLPSLLVLLGCTGASDDPPPTTDTDVPTLPTPPAPLLACPTEQAVFGFERLGEPLFATVVPESQTRTYQGRVTLPIDLPDPVQLWVLDQPVQILTTGASETERWVQYSVQATCTTCDHAHARIGGIDAPVVLTTATDPVADPVAASFDLVSTAWMVLGLATGEGPALAEPIAYQQRPDLNSYVQDLAGLLADDVSLRGTTGVNEHGHAWIDGEALYGVDDLIADPTLPTPPAPLVPWLLPIAQHAVDEHLVVWGPLGRSAAIEAVDGRYQVDLPSTGGDYAFRRVRPDSQSRASTLTYPPARFGRLEMRVFDGSRLELQTEPDHWVALRTGGDPIVCRTNEDGLVELERPVEPFEAVVLEPQATEVVAYRRCEPDLVCE